MKNKRCAIEFCLAAVLLLFALRHVTWGLDLSDTGYNYANYTYASEEHLGTMWWFSTYLTNLAGHGLTLLPFGDTLAGLNVYTGLLAGGISVLGYCFCTRRLGMSRLCAFAGEMTALCLCWCPTAKLYDYLTYFFLTACVVLLYEGLTRRKKGLLMLAGACLGTNVFVRFSNLPEAGLILAVWGFALLEGLEKRERLQKAGRSWQGMALAKAGAYTFWCLLGYLIPLLAGFIWIAIRYGLGEYAEGIRLLFAMTETASGYRAGSMVYGVVWPFWEGRYWMVRILFFVLAASLTVFAADHMPLCLRGGERVRKVCGVLGGLGTLGFTSLLIYWLYNKRDPSFTSAYFESYDPIYWPGVLFLTFAAAAGLVQLFRRGASRQEKLLAGMILLVIPLTSLGSNNGLYPSYNNLFLAAPYTLWEMTRFTGWAYGRVWDRSGAGRRIFWNFTPAAFAGWALIGMMLIQFFLFGLRFAYCEGTGIQERGYGVDNNRVLKGVEMSLQRARWIGEISGFANQNDLAGQEVILYGGIPSLSFYLEMPPAFHAWADLESYQYVTMRETMEELAGEIRRNEKAKPVVIAEKRYAPYGPLENGGQEDGAEPEGTGLGAKENAAVPAEGGNVETPKEASDPKWRLVREFMGQMGYVKTFENEKFVIWQAE